MIRIKTSLDHKRIRRLIWLVLTVFVLFGYSMQSVAGNTYYSMAMQNYATVNSPPVILQNGTAGTSTIYANGTSAKVSVAAPVPVPPYYPSGYSVLNGTYMSGTVPSSVQTVDSDYLIMKSVASGTTGSPYSPFDYNLLGSTTWVSGGFSDLETNNEVYMTFGSYYSGTNIQDFVDNNASDVDSSEDKGIHSNFTAQQYGPDSIYDTLTEVGISISDNNNVDSEIVTYGSTTGISGAQTVDGITENITEGAIMADAPVLASYEVNEADAVTSISVNKPSGTSSGDLLIILLGVDGITPQPSTPTGFTYITTWYAANSHLQCSWYREADGTEGASFSSNWSGGNAEDAVMACLRITGWDSGDFPHKIATNDSTGGDPVFPAVTTEKDNCLILRWYGMDDDDDSEPIGGVPSGHDVIFARETNSLTDGEATTLAACNRTWTTAGNTGTATWNQAATFEGWNTVTLAIAPPVVGYQLDVEHAVNSIAQYENYNLTTRAYRSSQNFYLQLYNFTSSQWVNMSTITASSLTWYNTSFAKADFVNSTNQARIRYWQGADATQETLYVDYSGVYGWNATNITFDAQTGTTAGGASASWPHTTGTGDDRLLVVGVAFEHDTTPYPSVSDVTYNGVGLTKIADRDGLSPGSDYTAHTSLWYMLNPPSGTHNINVTVSADPFRDIICYGISYEGVKQSAPDNYATSNSTSAVISVNLTAAADGSLAVFVCACGNEGTYTALTDCTIRDQHNASASESGCIGDAMDVSSGDKEVGASHSSINRASIVAAIWQPALARNYELDLEVQWTSANYTETNEELCIYAGSSGAENITVDVRSGSNWVNLFTNLSPGWNNMSVSSYLTSSTFTIRFKGGNETGDATENSWNIDVTLLRVWSPEYTTEVEFSGSSNTGTWTQLEWTIDSAWTDGSVSVTLQLYNYSLGDYPASGSGYMSYTSNATANTDETKSQNVTVNPANFRNATGYWKMKVKGVKATDTQFDFKADWIEFKPTYYSEYTVSTEYDFSGTIFNTPAQLNFTVVSEYDITSVNVTIQVWNYSSSNYVANGEGYLTYTSTGTNVTKTLSINTNPQSYTSGGNAKIKVTGVNSTTTQLQQKINQIKLDYTYVSGENIEDYVDNNTYNVDASSEKGTHSNFPAQQAGPDSIYDTLTEENTQGIEDYVDNNVSDVDGSGDKGTLSDFDNMKTKDGMANLTEEVGGTVWLWQEDTSGYVSTSSFETYQFWNSWTTNATTSGTITKIGIYVFADPGNSPQVKLGIYDDSGGSPNNLLGETNATTITGVGWLDLDIIGNGVNISSSTTYHVAHITDIAPNTQWRYYKDATPVSDYRGSVVWPNLFDPAGATTKSGSYRYGAYRVGYDELDYRLDQEVQFTNVIDFLPTEKLCIYTGTLGNEDLRVDYWNGTGWENVASDLTANSWNNYTVSLTSATYTIRFTGGTETGDTTQDTWQIDAFLLRVGGAGSKEDAVGQQSNIDGSADVGTHGNFTAQQYGPDSIYDSLTEEDTTGASDNNNVDSENITQGSTTGISGAQTTEGTTENMTESTIEKIGTDTSGTGSALNGSALTLSFSHTLVSGTNRIVIVTIGIENGDTTDVDSVTYGGQTCTKAIDHITGTTGFRFLVEIWYILDADLPSDGLQTVNVTCSGIFYELEVNAFCSEYAGVTQGAPEATHGYNQTSGSTITNTISPSDNAWVISGVGAGNIGNWTHFEGQVEVLEFDGNSSTFAVAELRGASGETSLSSNYTGSVNRLCRACASWTEAAQLDVEHVVNSIGEYENYNLTTKAYRTAPENFYLQMYNFTSSQWVNMSTITASSLTWYNTSFAKADFVNSTNQARIRYWQGADATQETLYVDYSGVYGWNATNYELDLEVKWTDLHYSLPNETLCIYGVTMEAEDIKVDVWNGTGWETVFTDLSSGWNNVSITDWLTTSNFTIRFKGGTETGDGSQDTWQIDVALIHVWNEAGEENYELDLEIQWTNANYAGTNVELCIKTGTFSGSENIQVRVWNNTGSSWHWVMNLTASQWNNVSITSYLTSNTFTVQYLGETETNDTSEDSWNIDTTLLHFWTTGTYDYVLRVNNTVTDSWEIRLKKYSDSNISRLQNCTIYFHNSTDGTSNQIIIENGAYINQTGPWYDLGDSETIYIAMTIQANSVATSYVYTYLEIRTPNTTTYAQYVVTFEIT